MAEPDPNPDLTFATTDELLAELARRSHCMAITYLSKAQEAVQCHWSGSPFVLMSMCWRLFILIRRCTTADLKRGDAP